MAGTYVALGDSMSIDYYAGGAGWGAASLLLRNRDADFPTWAGRDLASAGLKGLVLAADGARAADVLEHRLPLISTPPAVVTITMGGNDLLAAWGDVAAAGAAIGEVTEAGEVILARLGAAGSASRIVISTAGDPSQLLPRPASRDLWYRETIEPNAWGADQIRRTWWDALHTAS